MTSDYDTSDYDNQVWAAYTELASPEDRKMHADRLREAIGSIGRVYNETEAGFLIEDPLAAMIESLYEIVDKLDPRTEEEEEREASLPRRVLLAVPNHHRETDGGANHPGRFDNDEEAFISYMPNQHGEQMVFVVHMDGRTELYHGDWAWHPVEVEDGVAVGLILDEAERGFVAASWQASRPAQEWALRRGSS